MVASDYSHPNELIGQEAVYCLSGECCLHGTIVAATVDCKYVEIEPPFKRGFFTPKQRRWVDAGYVRLVVRGKDGSK